MRKYKILNIYFFSAMLTVLSTAVLNFYFQISLQTILVFCIIIMVFVFVRYMIMLGETFPGPRHDIAVMTFGLASGALVLAGIAYLDSSKDSEVLQLQLEELKKISQMLESKN
jgi:hypothetical protein